MVVTAERWPEKIGAILLPYERGPHSNLMADLAGAFGTDHATQVHAVHVLPWTATGEETRRAGSELSTELGGRYPRAEQKVVHSGDLISGLLREAKFADLIVMGAFLITFGALAFGFVLAFGLGSKRAVELMWEERMRRRDGRGEKDAGGPKAEQET